MNQGTLEEKLKEVDMLDYHREMATMTLPDRGQCIVDDETAVMDKEYFNALYEYSNSLPTGKYYGKRWKRAIETHDKCEIKEVMIGTTRYTTCAKHNDESTIVWWLAEYYRLEHRIGQIGISWRKIIVV